MREPIKFSFVLLKRRKRNDNTIPIYLRMRHNGTYSFMASQFSVLEKDFNTKANQKNWVRKTHSRYNVINDKLDELLREVETIESELPDSRHTTDDLIKAYRNKTDSLLSVALEKYRQHLDDSRRYWEHSRSGSVFNHWLSFLKDESIGLINIDLKSLNDFKLYLSHDLPKPHSENTLSKDFDVIKAFFEWAKLNGLRNDNPMDNFKKISRKRSKKTKLTIEEVTIIQNLELKKGSGIDKTRDAFIFAVFQGGIRIGDLLTLKHSNIRGNKLVYKMSKTKDDVEMPLTTNGKYLIDKYKTEKTTKSDFLFPFLDNRFDYTDDVFLKKQISSKNVMVNSNLKKIAKIAGIEKHITAHVARHSSADILRKSGTPLHTIKSILNHTKVSTTEIYLNELDQDDVDSAITNTFG